MSAIYSAKGSHSQSKTYAQWAIRNVESELERMKEEMAVWEQTFEIENQRLNDNTVMSDE